MSKVSEAKKAQNYCASPDRDICSTCKHYASDQVPSDWNPLVLLEKNIRCGIGGFATKKQATCSSHEFDA
jgi:hypothetical protein